MGEYVEIFEVGPRDGLQNEKRAIPVAEKIALTDLLSRAGFRRIECASFVSPKWVPQMAASDEVMAGITRAPGVRYAGLTPNLKGYAAAKAAKVDEIAVFATASEGFARANTNATVAEALARSREVAEAARADGMPVRGYISCVTDCPYEGKVAPEAVARAAEALRDMGVYELSLGDTIGHGTPESIAAMLDAVLEVLPAGKLAGHYHDTNGRAVENIAVSLEKGLRVFDAAVGGLGGCPYAPGAKGNVATEKVHDWLLTHGWETGLDRAVIGEAAAMAQAMRAG